MIKFENNENFLPDSKIITERFQLVLNEFYPRFKNILWKYIDDVDVVLPTAGMAGRVINKRLWKLNKNVHSIELGSMVDAVVGLDYKNPY